MKTCPLGHQCDSCLWQVEMQQVHKVTQELSVRKTCAIALLPDLLVNVSQETYGVGHAVESFRETMSKQNGALASALVNGSLTHEPQ